jgi:hypothetical protein
MTCRSNCGACCIAPSISSPIPAASNTAGMPLGKPAGVACVHLDEDMRCRIWGSPSRPTVCQALSPQPEMCGTSREEAYEYLTQLERSTKPDYDD